MSKVLIIDDNHAAQKRMYLNSPDFKGHELQFFEADYDAFAYLETLTPDQLPDICVVDALSGEFPFINTEAGLETARMLEATFRKRNHQSVLYLFKSADSKFARAAVELFRKSNPDSRSGTVSAPVSWTAGPRENIYRIDDNKYVPPVLPVSLKEFLREAASTHPFNMYDAFRDRITVIRESWDGLDQVDGTDSAPFITFDYAAGRPKSGRVVSSLSEVTGTPYGEKAILVCDDIPHDIMRVKDKLAAIVMTGKTDIPGHIRLLLQPHDISLLIGCKKECSIHSGQFVTVYPKESKLFLQKLDVVGVEAAMPRLVDAFDEMRIYAEEQLRRTSAVKPKFTINVSSANDKRNAPDSLFVGLTRTEHFISPYTAPDRWEEVKEFLIGSGPQLRALFARAGEKHKDLPLVRNRREAYNRRYRLMLNASLATISGYEEWDVVRLLDIPPDEFMSGDDLKKFQSLYGVNTRGVQLARQIPELYLNQIQLLMGCGKFRFEGFPRLLIPAVKTVDDVEFVAACVHQALPRECAREIRLGAMIETREACDNIAEIAKKVSFISIGSNDLTAAAHGVSRNDQDAIDYFRTLSPEVLKLIEGIVCEAREANPHIEISLCGEAAADMESLMNLKRQGIWIDSFSVPPTYKDSVLLPLDYLDRTLNDFCGPLTAEDENFYMGPRV